MSYRESSGYQRVHHKQVSTVHVKRAAVDSLGSRSQKHNRQKATKCNTTKAKWKHTGRVLQGKVLTTTAYSCHLSSRMLQQRRSAANLIGFQYRACPEHKGHCCHTCSNTSEQHRPRCGDCIKIQSLEALLCFVSV